jgi:hypothetical protein
MKRLFALPTGFASRLCAQCSVLLMLTSAAALAQSTDAANPPPAPAQPAVQDEASGGCEPIGLTGSGEIVFPFRCKDMVERQRAAATKPAEPTPAVANVAPAAAPDKPHVQPAAATVEAAHAPKTVEAKTVEAKTVEAKTVEAKTVEAKTVEAKPVEAKPVQGKTVQGKTVQGKTAQGRAVEIAKGVQPIAPAARDHAMGPPGCTKFRSYNAVSATYLAFDGQRYPCREVAGRPTQTQSRIAGNQPAPKQGSPTVSPAAIKH